MNNLIKKYFGKGSLMMAFAFMTTGVAMTSCSDDTLSNINTDKTKVSNLDPNAQLTTALLQTYGDFSLMDTYRNYITGFTQHFAGGWNVTNYAGSNFAEDDMSRRIWDRYYVISIKNLVDAIHQSKDKPNLNAADDAYIKYADSPYTYYDGANDYDFRTNALSEILYGQDATSPTFVSSTLFYQLQRTADPRLYRICRHYYNIKRSQVKPDKEENIDLTDEVLAYFERTQTGEEPCNPGAAWYSDWMSAPATSELPTLQKKADMDANTYDNSDFRARAMRPQLNIDFEMPNTPGDLMSYAEVEFLLAEAKTKGWNVSGDAESHYEAGVRASMQLLNNHYLTSNKISDDEINAFIAHNPLGENPKETINTQAWILHMMNPSEAWANMRRSDYPAILDRTRLGIFTNGFTYTDADMTMPNRLRYPELESQYNSANYKAAIERMGGTDNWHSKLYWDKNNINVQAEFNPPYGKGYIK